VVSDPELYAARPDLIDGLSGFVRSRPAQAVSDFLLQSDAIIAHDADAQVARIAAPTQITFGRYDQITSTRFADRLKGGIRQSELVVFENSAHVRFTTASRNSTRRRWRSCSAVREAPACSSGAAASYA
jgi:pimeloyl-ACP methyl ester carboxylesterase